MLRPKVLVLHADTQINAWIIILNLIFSGSKFFDNLSCGIRTFIKAMSYGIVHTLIAACKCHLLRTGVRANNRMKIARRCTKWNQLNIKVLVKMCDIYELLISSPCDSRGMIPFNPLLAIFYILPWMSCTPSGGQPSGASKSLSAIFYPSKALLFPLKVWIRGRKAILHNTVYT